MHLNIKKNFGLFSVKKIPTGGCEMCERERGEY
jgi:hypothetical protein